MSTEPDDTPTPAPCEAVATSNRPASEVATALRKLEDSVLLDDPNYAIAEAAEVFIRARLAQRRPVEQVDPAPDLAAAIEARERWVAASDAANRGEVMDWDEFDAAAEMAQAIHDLAPPTSPTSAPEPEPCVASRTKAAPAPSGDAAGAGACICDLRSVERDGQTAVVRTQNASCPVHGLDRSSPAPAVPADPEPEA